MEDSYENTTLTNMTATIGMVNVQINVPFVVIQQLRTRKTKLLTAILPIVSVYMNCPYNFSFP